MSDLDIVRQEHGLPVDTPLSVLVALELADAGPQLPFLTVNMAGEVEGIGDWIEANHDPDVFLADRLEDLEI
jgi:hypothetical protein